MLGPCSWGDNEEMAGCGGSQRSLPNEAAGVKFREVGG